MNDKENLVSLWDLIRDKRKEYYGASKKVYRKCDVDFILRATSDLHSLMELHTRCRLVPSNEEFRLKKAIPHYNSKLKSLKEAYPNIIEFQRSKFM